MNNVLNEEWKREIANDYAKLLFSDGTDINIINNYREKLGFSKHINAQESEKFEKQEEHIGIWKKTYIDGEEVFKRDYKYKNEYRYWADIDCIKHKKEKKRVLLLGESVASGFLYAPYLTPAKQLQKVLREYCNIEDFEVIDLSRVSIRIEQLNELCKQCHYLLPDIIIFFAGNNFRKSLFPLLSEEIRNIKLEFDNLDAVNIVLEKKMDMLIQNHMLLVKETVRKYNLPVLYIIPQTNLKDWRYIYNSNLTYWNGAKFLTPDEVNDITSINIDIMQSEEIEKLANDFIKQRATMQYGYKMLANLYEKEGRIKEAIYCYEHLRDTCWFTTNPPPLITSFIRERLKYYANRYELDVIDLSEVLNDSNSVVPGNEHFIDYCHLSEVGICALTAKIAKKIGEYIGVSDIDLKEVKADISDEVRSKAHFFAAIHCAHCGQPKDLVSYHLHKALEYSDIVINYMKCYMDMATRKVPWEINKNYFYLISSQYSVTNQINDCRLMDISLVQVMEEILEEYGEYVKRKNDVLRIDEHAPQKGNSVNLLDTYYRADNHINFISAKSWEKRKKAYISFRHINTKFYLIANPELDVVMKLTYRTPFHNTKEKSLKFSINRHMIINLPVSASWRNEQIEISSRYLNNDGINIIQIEWLPMCDKYTEIVNYYYSEHLTFEQMMEICNPIYGEIFWFKAFQGEK